MLQVGYAQRYSSRTTKPMVRDELGIPEQTRYLVPIDLGRVEKHVSVLFPLFSTSFQWWSVLVLQPEHGASSPRPGFRRSGCNRRRELVGPCFIEILDQKASGHLHPSPSWSTSEQRGKERHLQEYRSSSRGEFPFHSVPLRVGITLV